MPDFTKINISDFTYPLPDDRIARFPVSKRDESKLLVHKNGSISEDMFTNIVDHLIGNSLLILNDTKVVRARLQFVKPTGAAIEVFCLEPVSPTTEIQLAFQQRGSAVWKCLVGNAKRWKEGALECSLNTPKGVLTLKVEKIKREGDSFLLGFSWQPPWLTFSEVLEIAGKVPLPPYLHREAKDSDIETYQTIYARFDGSVAAPTAGLHFTPEIFQSLSQANINCDYVTLHVGAGTFKPVGDDGLEKHEMHTEQVIITWDIIQKLLDNIGKTVAVGTTSVRTLESLYWYGAMLEINPDAEFFISQYDPYFGAIPQNLDAEQVLSNVLEMLNSKGIHQITGSTQMMIVPGYQFRIINGMVTNFHQPQSTLLLLIAAWLGAAWRDIYSYALNHDFRFLSYGDACLFLR